MLEAAAAAPDHGALRPFRFTLLRGTGLDAFGTILERSYLLRCRSRGEEPVASKVEKERSKLHRAPLVIVVGAARQQSPKVPWSDQRDAAVAAATIILLAAHALGYGAMWRTGEICDDGEVKRALELGPDDAIVGFLYVGTPVNVRPDRTVELSGLVREFDNGTLPAVGD
jgi:nitroreductase